ncbi:MAG TPA: N-formylglutamate amidohydrolase [Alphaproteobacteria bacterium]|nr:N-formylglutamate amidohydrolase [Alphaproteobacteria bacterium]
MDGISALIERNEIYEIAAPVGQTVAGIFASPHSGTDYRAEFLEQTRLDQVTLRRSEDAFVDELFQAAPQHGAPLLKALFPRAYVDPNREPWELDAAMFSEPLPAYVNSRSPRVAAGLGTIARVVANGEEIYARKLDFADAAGRIERCYKPYHAALRRLIDLTCERFGWSFLIDCHSMPSVGGPMDRDPGMRRVDFVLGDCHGASCGPALIDTVEAYLTGLGYVVTRNLPYAGGYVTRHYGRPERGVHVLQIEVNRALYMDEERVERRPRLNRLAAEMEGLITVLAELDGAEMAA